MDSGQIESVHKRFGEDTDIDRHREKQRNREEII